MSRDGQVVALVYETKDNHIRHTKVVSFTKGEKAVCVIKEFGSAT